MRAMLFGEMLYDGKLCFNTFAWGWSPFLKQCLRHMSDTNYGVLRTDCGLRTADLLCTIGNCIRVSQAAGSGCLRLLGQDEHLPVMPPFDFPDTPA